MYNLYSYVLVNNEVCNGQYYGKFASYESAQRELNYLSQYNSDCNFVIIFEK